MGRGKFLPFLRWRVDVARSGCQAVVYRFCAALVLVVLVSLAGTALEKETLALRREVTRQVYRRQVLESRLAGLAMEVQRSGAPVRHVETANRLRQEAVEAAAVAKPKPPRKPRTTKASGKSSG
jgi:hypothetical protein